MNLNPFVAGIGPMIVAFAVACCAVLIAEIEDVRLMSVIENRFELEGAPRHEGLLELLRVKRPT